MGDFALLQELGVVVVGATALLLAGRLLRFPPILAYLLAGLALGPATGVLRVSHSLEVLSEIGVALLLFLVGLELSIDKVRDIGRSAVMVGAAQVVLTLAGGALLAALFGFGITEAIFLGLAVTFSSTVVVVKLLDRTGALEEPHGRISIGVLLVQDILVAVVLTLVSGLGVEGATGWTSVVEGLARAFAGMGVLVAAAALAVRRGLPALFRWLAASPEALFVASIAWCFGFLLAAEAMHVSVELGAFVAGVALAQLPHCDQLRRRVHPLVDFFVAVFFVALGAGMDLSGAAAHWFPALVLSAWVLLGKPAIVAALVGRSGGSPRTAVQAGITLGQVSEFAFLVVGLAAGTGLLGPDIVSLVGLVGLVTIGASSVLVPSSATVAAALERRGLLGILASVPADEGRAREPAAEDAAGHVVVVGMNAFGRRAVEAFAGRDVPVVAVDSDDAKLRDLPARSVVGDVSAPSVLEEAAAGRARLVVSALRIEDVNQLLVYRCRKLGVPTAVHGPDPGPAEELREIGADHVVVSKRDAARQIAGLLKRLGVAA